MVKELDVLNIPFWSSNDNDYLRLFKSSLWDRYVLSKMSKYNIKVLFPYVVGARTASSTKKFGKVIKPKAASPKAHIASSVATAPMKTNVI